MRASVCEVSLRTLVLSEITQVTSLMRKNARWSGPSGSGSRAVGSSSSRSGTPNPNNASNVAASSSSSASDSTLRTSSLATTSAASSSNTLSPPAEMSISNDRESSSMRGKKSRERLSGGIALVASVKGKEPGHNGALARSSIKQAQPPPGDLLSGFALLRDELKDVEDPRELDALLLLSPFLDVVRSGDMPGAVTALALTAVDKFIAYGIVHRGSPNLVLAMTAVAGAGTHCKFEASDSTSDEVVLLKILELLKNTLTSDLGAGLSDEAVCEMMETGLGMCCQMRLSEMLRKSSERSMQTMIAAIFTRLRDVPNLEDQVDEAAVSSGYSAASPSGATTPKMYPNGEDQSLRMVLPDPTSAAIPAASTPAHDILSSAASRRLSYLAATRDVQAISESPQSGQDEGDDDLAMEVKPYGLPSIREILRVLISLLNPHDQQNTDSMRATALSLVNVAFEVGGSSISRCAELRNVVADDLCKYLFQLARSENTALLASSLRVITNIIDTMRQHLKLQQELFLSFLMDRLIRPVTAAAGVARKGELESELDASTWNMADTAAPSLGKSVSSPLAVSSSRRSSGSLNQSTMHSNRQVNNGLPYSEGRHLMLEYLAQFAKAEDFMTNLWINYDCNVDCEDVFERVVKFFSRGVYPNNPSSHTPEHSQYVCLDTLLEFVNALYSRLDDAAVASSTAGGVDPARLQSAKASKRNLLEGALRFNEKPKDGLAFLEAKGLIFTNDNAHASRARALAQFLKGCPRLDKRLLGDFLSRPDNLEVLKEFLNLFDFRDKVISEAMREMLESFRLPGEAQQIDRITETFSHAYTAVNKNEVKNSDAAYVLAFSIIMLNTDLHSPQVRKRMTYDDYCRNLKGVNDKEDFPPEYLRAIYDGIRKREMVMPEEHTGILGFEYAWKELLRRASSAGTYEICTSNQFDSAIFTLSWKPIVSALSYAFTHFTDEFDLQRIIAGFQQCASLAHRFDLPEVFDHIIHSLSKITSLCGSQPQSEAATTYPTIDVDGQTVTVSALALRFGKSSKAQLAAIVLFAIANDNAKCIDQSWVDIFEIYLTFFTYSLLPQSLLNMEEFLAGTPAIPLKVRAPQPPAEEKRRNDGGLLSTLSSYLLSPYANGQEGIGREITDDDVESTLTTIDCIASCRVDQLYSSMLSLPPHALRAAIASLVDLAERATLDKVRHRPIPGLASGPPSPVIGKAQVAYDATTVFLLELLMSIAGEAEREARQSWPLIFEFVTKLLSNATSFHHILLERAVAGMLRLAALIAKYADMRDQVFVALDTLHTLPAAMLQGMSDQIATGLARILHENPDIAGSMTEWNLIFGLWSATASKEASAAVTFELITQLSSGSLGQGLNSENFVGFVRVLNDFATIAGHGDLQYRNSPDGANDPVVLRGKHSLSMIRDAQSMANALIKQSSLNAAAAWETYWLPVLSVYSQQSVNGCREIRQIALANLQRTLVAHEVLSNAEVDLTMVFERLIFPMLDELLKPQVFRRDPEGMGETRLRATALLCKIFLHYLIQLSERQGMAGMTDLWMKILGYLDRFMHSGRRDQMYEAVPESLKNVLLVMHASGFLVPPHQMPRTEDQARLWEATFDRLDIFLPILRQDLFPTPVAATRTSQLALQPAPARSPSPTPPIRSDGRMHSNDGDATPSQSMSVYL